MFETKEGMILIEAILRSSTSDKDKIYISGPFNGGDELAVGNSTWQLERSTLVPLKWGVYLNPADFIDGKTLADGFWFVSKQKGRERTSLNEDANHTLDAQIGKFYNVYIDKWAADFSNYDPDPDPEVPEEEGSGPLYVKIQAEDCYISVKMDANTDLLYWFKRCMANELYTFYRVGVVDNSNEKPVNTPDMQPKKVLNEATSDNIGPFMINGKDWVGGNHKDDSGNKTAESQSREIFLNGEKFSRNVQKYVSSVSIKTTNKLGGDFAVETVEYNILEDGIEVSCNHEFTCPSPVKVDRYYGMQSMFVGETKIKTPNGLYPEWTSLSGMMRFNAKDFPNFRVFIETDGKYCQSAELYDVGLGTRAYVNGDGPAFIGNSYGKSYHCLMWDHTVSQGDKTFWKGKYSWYRY